MPRQTGSRRLSQTLDLSVAHALHIRRYRGVRRVPVRADPPRRDSLDYVRNIRVHYLAEEIVYVLQALSTGMTGIFIGLIANYLYDKTKKPNPKIEVLTNLLAA